MIQILLGNFTFEGLIGDSSTKCIIHEIHEISEFENLQLAVSYAEDNVSEHGSWLIPSIFKGEITWDETISDVQDGTEICANCGWFCNIDTECYTDEDTGEPLCGSCSVFNEETNNYKRVQK